MQNILLLFSRFGSHIVFLVLQIICFILIVNYNRDQRSIFLNSSSYYANFIDGKTSKWFSYLSLAEVNDSLAKENAQLLQTFINQEVGTSETAPIDTTRMYRLIAARVVNNTSQLRNNHFTFNMGSDAGIEPNMGVIDEDGLVGITRNVSRNFAHVNSLLHSQTRISAKVKPYNYPGNLLWKGSDPKVMTLEAIPKYADISVGDTVITSGYSTIFPPDLMIGTVQDFSINKGSGNYSIRVKLSNDIPNVKIAYFVDNEFAEEQKALEQEVVNE